MKIGVVDSGINPDLPEFAGRIDAASGDAAGNRGTSDQDGHGTAVSAVAAAGRNGQGTMGVAFNATIVSQRADTPGSCESKDGCSFGDAAIATGIDRARAAGARVINLSLGGGSPGSAVLSAMQRAVIAGIVLVISAGNDGEEAKGANADPFALTPAQHFPGMVVIAGSVGTGTSSNMDTSTISDFSNRAGTGADHYLAAVGFYDRAPDHTGAQYQWNGTSFSAPAISGAVALLAQAFPNLTGAQVVDILFKSADDLGAAGIDSIYGRGRLNIARAMQPIGTTSLADSKVAVTTTNGDLPSASGDALTGRSLGAVILDGYDRAYVINLAATLRQAEQDRPLSRALQEHLKSAGRSAGPLNIAMTVRERRDAASGFELERTLIGPDDRRRARLVAGSAVARINDTTAVAFGFAEGAKAMERRLNGAASGGFLIARDVAGHPGFSANRNGSVAFRRSFGGTGVTFSGETGKVWQEVRTSATGAQYRWSNISVDRSFGSNWLTAGVGQLNEKESLLGGRMGEALGGGGATTVFVDLELSRHFIDGWSAGLSARRGWTTFAAGKFLSGAYGVDLAKLGVFGSRDRLGVRIAQPLRIEHGGFATLLPTGYDYATGLVTSTPERLSLTPNGRELNGELSYGSSLLAGRGWFGGNFFYRHQPGHVLGASDDVGAALRVNFDF